MHGKWVISLSLPVSLKIKMKKLFNNFTFNPKDDILSGLTIALALVPEAVAFAFVAGVNPLVGLYGAFIIRIGTLLVEDLE